MLQKSQLVDLLRKHLIHSKNMGKNYAIFLKDRFRDNTYKCFY